MTLLRFIGGNALVNSLWIGFFLVAFITAMFQWLVNDNAVIFEAVVESLFKMANLGFEISLGLVGVLCLWMGVFQVAEKAGIVHWLARFLNPLFRRLMPEVPAGHPAQGAVTMNLAANMLGLDNAATPLGLKAMKELQSLNQTPQVASNAQILFLVLNTSSVTLLPVTVFMYRMQMGAADPTAVFLPIILATSASTLAGLMAVAWIQRLKILDPVVLGYFAFFALFLSTALAYFSGLSAAELSDSSSLFANLILLSIIVGFFVVALKKGINVYETFVEGAKQGFSVALTIAPYLIAMLVAIGAFRASGAFTLMLDGIRAVVTSLGFTTSFVDALPTAFMKPLSGSGARAMMVETMNTHGVDSYAGYLSAVIQGSTETTLYVLAVYFGAVGITRGRHALACGLLADVAGVIAAIAIGAWFWQG